MTTKQVHSIGELWSAVAEAKLVLGQRARDMGLTKEAEEPVWYRGQPKVVYTLTPSLFRTANGTGAEGRLYREYRAFKPVLTEWETLFHMQHFFVPTRLLDWTTDWATALYFALNDDDSKTPSIYILHPCLLNREAFKEDWVLHRERLNLYPFYPDERRGGPSGCPFRYPEDYVDDPHRAHRSPIALRPGINNDRIMAQCSMFTIHGSDERPIESLCENCLVKIEIHLRADEIKLLRDLGRNSRDVFPDETGMSLTLRNQFGLKRIPHAETIIKEAILRIWEEDDDKLRNGKPGKLHMEGLADCRVGLDYIKRSSTSEEIEDWLKTGEKPLAIVLGPAARGKTNLIADFVFEDRRYSRHMFLFCRLNDFKPRERTLGEFLAASLARMAQKEDGTEVPIDDLTLQSMVSEGRIVLILDGLDELVRIQGEESAAHLGSQIRRLRERGAGRAGILVGCRDHIVRNLEGKANSLVEDVRKIKLDEIPEGQIRKKWEVEDSVAKVVGHVPLLCRVLPVVNPKSVKNESELWGLWLDEAGRRLPRPLARPELLNQLGVIATLMLKRRDDFLLEKQFETTVELMDLIRGLADRTQNPCPLFVREVDGKWRFAHQAIREYVLASNIKYGLDHPNSENVLTATSALDYESAETYTRLQDLLEDSAKGDKHMPIGYLRGLDSMADDEVKRNNFARNYFEALGMLGVRNETEREAAVEQALDAISAGPEVRCKTKYNAARCLMRLHPTSPSEYCEWASRSSWPEIERGRCVVVYGYAVRGFHQTRLKVDRHPVEVFLKELADVEREHSKYPIWSAKASELLLAQIEGLALISVPRVGERFLQINCAHALIRWLHARDKSLLYRVRNLMNNTSVRREARMNLFLALCVHDKPPDNAHEILVSEIDGKPLMPKHFAGDIEKLCGLEDDSIEDDC